MPPITPVPKRSSSNPPLRISNLRKPTLPPSRATNERAQSDLARYTPLLSTGDVSKFQYDAVDASARVAKSEFDAAQQQLAAAQQAVRHCARQCSFRTKRALARSQSQFLETKARERQVPITEATYKSALASVGARQSRAPTSRNSISPIHTSPLPSPDKSHNAPSISDSTFPPGQLLFTIVPLTQVYVTANFKETQLARVAPGQKVRHSRRYL